MLNARKSSGGSLCTRRIGWIFSSTEMWATANETLMPRFVFTSRRDVLSRGALAEMCNAYKCKCGASTYYISPLTVLSRTDTTSAMPPRRTNKYV